jgi:AraC-like DNA-binding protein
LWGVELVRILFGGFGQSDIVVVTWGFIALFNYFVSYKAFSQQDLFDASIKKNDRKVISSTKAEEQKAVGDNTICERIRISMETEKFYLKQDLSIHDFAKEINTSPRLISTCINKSFGFNFNEWVNNYRVDKALEILKDKNSDLLSIEGVGSDSGFKSRSAMYIAFKKKTGETPGYFRTH